MSYLKRHLAPLSEQAWEEVDQEARNVLTARLAARRFVDVIGPLGFDASAVTLGRLDGWKDEDGAHYALRKVQPLVEVRVPFVVSRTELENLGRGASDVDLDAVAQAARVAARFEERAVHHGASDAGIEGLCGATTHDAVELGDDIAAMPDRIARALIQFTDAGVEGPYLLVLGEKMYAATSGHVSGYPLRQQLTKLLGTAPVYSPGLDHGLLVSTRGGDFELNLGADMAVGFDRAEGDDVHLFLCETFTFRVTGGEAVIVLR